MMQVPETSPFTVVLPVTEHTDGVRLVKVTALPELVVALIPVLLSGVMEGVAPKVMVVG